MIAQDNDLAHVAYEASRSWFLANDTGATEQTLPVWQDVNEETRHLFNAIATAVARYVTFQSNTSEQHLEQQVASLRDELAQARKDANALLESLSILRRGGQA
jgi:hypothetical protein